MSSERHPSPPKQTVVPARVSRFDITTVGRFEPPRLNEMSLPPVPETVPDRRVATAFDLVKYAEKLAKDAGSPEAHEYLLQTLGLAGKPDVLAMAWAREALVDKIRCHKEAEDLEEKLAAASDRTVGRERYRNFLVRELRRARAAERKAEIAYLARMKEAERSQIKQAAQFNRQMREAEKESRDKLARNPLTERLLQRARAAEQQEEADGTDESGETE